MQHDAPANVTLPPITAPIRGRKGAMTRCPTKWLLAGLLCLTLWPMRAYAQDLTWEAHISAGAEALQRGDYAQAEKELEAAVGLTKWFSPEDPRLATSLNDLAQLYEAQGRYAEAEPLYGRALAI